MENPIYAFISDNFKNINYDLSYIRTALFDIEVETIDGFPDVKTANRLINSITIYCDNKYHVFGLKDYKIENDNEIYYKCKDEIELLKKFIELWVNLNFDVLSAWYGDQFDIPYLINRISKILGKKWVDKLSPYGIVKPVSKTEYSDKGFSYNYDTYEIYGIIFLDHMKVYKNFNDEPRENYKLNFIADIELKDEKIDYSEFETLKKLYEEDHQKYIRYNIKDVGLMVRLEEKLKFFQLLYEMAFSAGIIFQDVFKQTRLWDGIIYNHLKNKNIIIPKKPPYIKISNSYSGGYVKDPIPNLYRWAVSLDATSLYPHIFMQYNISPETYRGKISVDFKNMVNGISHGYENKLKMEDLALTASGALFSRTEVGFLPELLEIMFSQRKQAKDLMINLDKEYQTKNNTLSMNEKKYYENEIQKYNLIQLAKKKQLVACYGAFGNTSFRYYLTDIAEAITTSGRLAFQWTERKVNEKLTSITGVDKSYVIYGDTDSVWVNFEDIVNKYLPKNTNRNKIVDFLDAYVKSKMNVYLETSLKEMSLFTNGIGSRIHFKREKITDVAVFKKKKRYFVNVLDSEGVRYEKPVLKVTGMESKRVSVASICREAFEKLYWIICNENEAKAIEFLNNFKEEFIKTNVENVGIPKSANTLDDYGDFETIYKKGTPGHIRSALLFNHWIKKLKIDKKYEKIISGEKIKYCFLKTPNPIHENMIGFISKLPEEFNLNEYIDWEEQYYRAFFKSVEELFNIIGWDTKEQVNLEELYG